MTDATAPAAASAPAPETQAPRRSDIDWLRVIAFGILILFHVGLAFSPWSWHINVQDRQEWVPILLKASDPWRLTLLFLISGAAVGLMRKTGGASGLILDRSRRILPALFLGVIFIVPPQAYAEWADKSGYDGTLFEFIGDYAARVLEHGFPTNHLWFLVFIWFYGLGAALIYGFAPGFLTGLRSFAERSLKGAGLILIPMAYCVAMRLMLHPIFGQTNNVSNDWYHHAVAFAAFIFGFAIARSDIVWDRFAKTRVLALGLGLIGYAGTLIFYGVPYYREIAYGMAQWGAVAAALGYGRAYLSNAQSPLLRYLSSGVFSFYVLHQTITVLAVFYLKPFNLPVGQMAFLVIAITALGCWLGYEIIRRSNFLSAVFSARPKLAGAASRA